MNRGIVAGNWKMHGSRQFVIDYLSALAGQRFDGRLLLIPPAGYLSLLADLVAQHGLSDRVELGAQNLHPEASGPFTGEMSGEMLKDLGAAWVLVGHSERRQFAGEDNQLVAAKFVAALRADLKPILCVGETAAEREAGSAAEVVVGQLEAVLELAGIAGLAQGGVAYEPVWAIGTGKTATPALAQEMHGLIRGGLAKASSQVAATIPVLYGGSVKGSNARALFAEEDIDGGLVGGASLEAGELAAIARCLAP